MKRLLTAIACSALFASALPSVALAGDCYVDPVIQYSGTGTVKSAVFLRDKACVSGSSILITLSARATVQVIGFTDGWYRVEASNGARGWVGQHFIETGAQDTGTRWSSYDEYMAQYPSRSEGPTPTLYTPSSAHPSPDTYLRRLLKLACPSGAAVDHPCKAVYYIGADGKRHAFPNSRIFFTWYLNFNDVMTVSSDVLGSIPLAKNVAYRPGARMVKFTTLNKVYAVGRGGVLRWVKTEEAARTLYGADWNKKIDDIPDTFYMDYTFGADIESESDFSPQAELEANATFD